MNENLIKPEGSPPFIEEGRGFWRDIGKELIKNSIDTLDNVAKQVIVVSGILIGLYYNGIKFIDVKLLTKHEIVLALIYIFPAICFSLSVTFALLVFFPNRFKINFLSSDSAKSVYESIIKSSLPYMNEGL